MPSASSTPASVLIENRGAVRVLVMNRPEKLNALDTALTAALLEAIEDADRDASVGALVLAGRGRAFCAGADLEEFKHLTPDQQERVTRRADLTCRLQSAMQTISKPVVSAVQGAAVGGGAGLAIGCDMMIAATDLKFGYPEVRHGIVPAIVMTGLQRQIGRKLAFELISTGRFLTGEEAVRQGLANQLVAPGDVLEVAIGVAAKWADVHPAAMAATKALFYRVADLPFSAAMAAGRDVNAIMRGFRGSKK